MGHSYRFKNLEGFSQTEWAYLHLILHSTPSGVQGPLLLITLTCPWGALSNVAPECRIVFGLIAKPTKILVGILLHLLLEL